MIQVLEREANDLRPKMAAKRQSPKAFEQGRVQRLDPGILTLSEWDLGDWAGSVWKGYYFMSIVFLLGLLLRLLSPPNPAFYPILFLFPRLKFLLLQIPSVSSPLSSTPSLSSSCACVPGRPQF